MQIISARNFRANQTHVLTRAKSGESIVLTSRVGMFKLTPINEQDALTTRICRGLDQVKAIQNGKLPKRSIEDMLNEL